MPRMESGRLENVLLLSQSPLEVGHFTVSATRRDCSNLASRYVPSSIQTCAVSSAVRLEMDSTFRLF